MGNVNIRAAGVGHCTEIELLYPAAFPEEDLRPLVRALLQATPDVISLVALVESELIGHVVFTPCSVSGGGDGVSLLGPLVVAAAWKRRGVGSALVRAGLDRLRTAGFDHVFVLGDPGYYSRFGFQRERAVASPFPLPEDWNEAWQSIRLRDGAPRHQGKLRVPRAWDDPALWAP